MSLPSPAKGSIVFDATHNVLRLYNGSQWVALLGEAEEEYYPPFAWKAGSPVSDWGDMADYSDEIVVDNNGNIYITGYFSGQATFGTTTLTSSGSKDIFIAKYTGSGSLLWAQKAGGTSEDKSFGIAIDATGNSYITGNFLGSATFGSITLTSGGSQDIFVAKYNTSGVLQWAQRAGGTHSDSGEGIAVDPSGNVYITGGFYNTAAFGTTNLTSTGNKDIFLTKYNTNGVLQWAQKAGGVSEDGGQALKVDASGNIYLTGFFYGVATFYNKDVVGSSSLTSTGSRDIFLTQYNSAGTLQWIQKAGGVSYDDCKGLALDVSGNAYLTGFFSETSVFGTTSLTVTGSYDIFLAKYNTNGTFQWAQKAGGSNDDRSFGIATDAAGNVYLTGSFLGTSAFGSTTLTSAGSQDIFVAKYNTNGAFQWAQKAGGTTNDAGSGIATDSNRTIYITGTFYGTAIFGTTTLTAAGSGDVFIAKYNIKP